MISRSDFKYIHQAMTMAENSPCYNQHGCVLVQNGRIVSQGYNHYEISKYSLSSNTTHAEIDALTKYFKTKFFKSKVREKGKQEKE
jgi:pyrimidine deaminase RibD-like protein